MTHKHFKKPRILFILKYRHIYDDTDFYTHAPDTVLSSGLFNSATFISDLLVERGFESKVVHVVDNNGIDKVVTQYKPDLVMIEALWVIPSKFEVLQKLHPNVKWIVRVHSEIPFLAREGSSIEWIAGYLRHKNVYVAFNSAETFEDFIEIGKAIGHGIGDRILYLPNYYPVRPDHVPPKPHGECLDVGCFGALRPMKNQLIQAIAAVEYAKKHNLCLRFHINSTRKDNDSAIPVLKNIRAFFDTLDETKYTLVEHSWLERPEFLKLVRTMDIGMQVSLSESFNIITADYVSEGVPVVVSPEIHWVPSWFHAKTNNAADIVKVMERAMWFGEFWEWTHWVHNRLKKEVNMNAEIWIEALRVRLSY